MAQKMGEAAKTTPTPSANLNATPPQKYVPRSKDEKARDESLQQRGRLRRFIDVLSYVPPKCRYDPEKPFQFSIGLNILFGMLLRSVVDQAAD